MRRSKSGFLQYSAASAMVIGLVLWHWTAQVGAIWLELSPHGAKCLSEEIQPNVVLMGNYTLFSNDNRVQSTMSVKLTSPYGNTLHNKERVSEGQFALTTKEPGNYLACFWMDGKQKGMGGNVNLDWKIGIAARDWDSIARMEKIEGVELELRKLETKVAIIREKLVHLMNRLEAKNLFHIAEANFVPTKLEFFSERTRGIEQNRLEPVGTHNFWVRGISEKTNARVAWLSIISLFICISVSIWQMWHLESFFKKKKLL